MYAGHVVACVGNAGQPLEYFHLAHGCPHGGGLDGLYDDGLAGGAAGQEGPPERSLAEFPFVAVISSLDLHFSSKKKKKILGTGATCVAATAPNGRRCVA